MSHKRDKLGVAELNDQLYAVGGHNGDGYLSSVERFDPDVGTWEEVAAMRSKRNGPGVAVLDHESLGRLFPRAGHSSFAIQLESASSVVHP